MAVERHDVSGQEFYLASGMRVADEKTQQNLVCPQLLPPYRKTSGLLLLIGGGTTMENFQTIAEQLIPGTGITINTTPTADPDGRFEEIAERLIYLGVPEERMYHLSPETTRDEGKLMLQHSSIIYTSGGDQLRGYKLLEENGLVSPITHFYRNGNSVSGSSAGASIVSEEMTYGEKTVAGLGLTDTIIFTHVKQRKREGRVLRTVDRTKRAGIGLNEGGMVIFEGNRIHAMGDYAMLAYPTPQGVEQAKLEPGEQYAFAA